MGIIKRYIVVPLMIFSIMGGTLFVPYVLLDFEIRKDYIANVLCIERNKSENTCMGSCYLSQKLEKTANHHTEDLTEINPINFSFFHQKDNPIEINHWSQDNKKVRIDRSGHFKHRILILDFFHPPRG